MPTPPENRPGARPPARWVRRCLLTAGTGIVGAVLSFGVISAAAADPGAEPPEPPQAVEAAAPRPGSEGAPAPESTAAEPTAAEPAEAESTTQEPATPVGAAARPATPEAAPEPATEPSSAEPAPVPAPEPAAASDTGAPEPARTHPPAAPASPVTPPEPSDAPPAAGPAPDRGGTPRPPSASSPAPATGPDAASEGRSDAVPAQRLATENESADEARTVRLVTDTADTSLVDDALVGSPENSDATAGAAAATEGADDPSPHDGAITGPASRTTAEKPEVRERPKERTAESTKRKVGEAPAHDRRPDDGRIAPGRSETHRSVPGEVAGGPDRAHGPQHAPARSATTAGEAAEPAAKPVDTAPVITAVPDASADRAFAKEPRTAAADVRIVRSHLATAPTAALLPTEPAPGADEGPPTPGPGGPISPPPAGDVEGSAGAASSIHRGGSGDAELAAVLAAGVPGPTPATVTCAQVPATGPSVEVPVSPA